MKKLCHKGLGFTLIELIVAMAVMVVFVTVAVPAFQTLSRNNRLITQNNTLISSLNLARSEAVKRVVPVTVCASTNHSTCNTSLWEKGWIIFTDVNGDRVVNSPPDEIVRTGNELQGGGNTLRAEVFTNTAWIQYNARGNVNSAGTFVLCDSRGDSEARGINIEITGRIRVASDDDNPANNIIDNVSGNDVNCP